MLITPILNGCLSQFHKKNIKLQKLFSKYKISFFFFFNHHIRMISEGSCDSEVGLGDMAQKIITIIIFISVDIDNYHDKCQIFISFKFKARFLLQSESFRNQTINFP